MSEKQKIENGVCADAGFTLGINSLHNQPLMVSVPPSALLFGDDSTAPEVTYDFIHKLDSVLRTVEIKTPGDAYKKLASEMGVEMGSDPAAFWHYRHWDDQNALATFIVFIPDNHLCEKLAGHQLLASSRHHFFTTPCLAPQVESTPAIMVLVDGAGDMVLPFDEPLNNESQPTQLGAVIIPVCQFISKEQANQAGKILEMFGYSVEFS